MLVSIISQRLFPTPKKESRRAALEILLNNSAVANLIRNEKNHQIQNVMQTSRAQGMMTLEASVQELVTANAISRDVAAPYLRENSNHYGSI